MNRQKAKGKPKTEPSSSSSSSKNCFPSKLHYILGEMENDGLHHIMCWQSSGRSFKIHDQQQLENEILQKWFCQRRFASFQRQLNIYGFVRISSGVDKGGYYHSMFLRDRPELASQIPRKKGNTTTVTTPRASTPQTAGVEDSNMTSQGRETSQLISLSFPMLASPSLLSSNPSAMGGAHLSNPPPSTSTGNVDFLSSLVFSPNNTNSSSLSSLCASRLGQELLSLLSRPAPQLPTSVSSTVSPITTGLLQHAGPENNAALLELLLRSEGAGTSVNGTSITSAAAGHYRNLLNRNMTNWQHQRPPDDRR